MLEYDRVVAVAKGGGALQLLPGLGDLAATEQHPPEAVNIHRVVLHVGSGGGGTGVIGCGGA
jgi:hypothetical protein